MEVSENEKELLGLAGLYPYLPSKEELAEHKKQYTDFENVQKFEIMAHTRRPRHEFQWMGSGQCLGMVEDGRIGKPSKYGCRQLGMQRE